jgi:PAS domain S-box-containing protein
VKGLIQIFNVGAERALGYTADEVMNKITPTELHDPEELAVRAAAMSLEFATPIAPTFEALVFRAARGIEDIYEITKVRKDGSRFPALVSVTALRDAQDTLIGYLMIATDNTARKQVEEERKRAEEGRRTSEALYRALFECAPDGIVIADSESCYIDANPSICGMLGYTRDEMIGLHASDIVAAKELQRIGPALSVINARGDYQQEWQFQRKDGSLFDAEVFATKMPDDNLLGMIRDVTERKRFEEALHSKNIELEEGSRMKSEFLANMSHELRTPLNSIIGFSEVLKDGLTGEMTDKQRGFVGDIFGSGQHLLSLINDILDLSKVEAGKMKLDLEEVQVPALLANGMAIVREKAAAHRIRTSMEVAEELGATIADPRKVKQIVYNLLSNAVKFTDDGGQVAVRAARVPRAEVGRPSCAWAGRTFPLGDSAFAEFLEIRVRDSGIGISRDGLEKLFKPFSQIDGSLARRFEGTGLGLAMVKLLADLHGGTVAVESAVGEGSCFTVWLPLRASGEGALMPARAPGTPIREPAGARIALVVEDDYKSAELIRVHLEAEGFKVLHASSAKAALELALQQPVELITLDILLPDMEGWEFLTRIKQVPDLRRTPVVIISIVADSNKGFSLGASAVVQKPISRKALYESLVDLGLLPLSQGKALKVLVADDDPKAVELIALSIRDLAGTVLRAHGGREAIDVALRELPDVIVLDLMMPEVNGFDVVAALNGDPKTAHIPILVATAKQITDEDREKLSRYVVAIMEKAEFAPGRFTAEIRRAMSGRTVGA